MRGARELKGTNKANSVVVIHAIDVNLGTRGTPVLFGLKEDSMIIQDTKRKKHSNRKRHLVLFLKSFERILSPVNPISVFDNKHQGGKSTNRDIRSTGIENQWQLQFMLFKADSYTSTHAVQMRAFTKRKAKTGTTGSLPGFLYL